MPVCIVYTIFLVWQGIPQTLGPYIDATTLETITRTIPLIRTAPVFLLITFRPEFMPPWLDHSHVTMLRLNRLPREQVGAMVIDVTDGMELPPEVNDQIIRKSDGVPLFVEELTKTVLESGQLHVVGDRYIAIPPLRSFAIPETLHDSLIARLDRLASIKEIAQIGAVLGREFSYRLLAAVAPNAGAPLEAALAQLAAAELIFAVRALQFWRCLQNLQAFSLGPKGGDGSRQRNSFAFISAPYSRSSSTLHSQVSK